MPPRTRTARKATKPRRRMMRKKVTKKPRVVKSVDYAKCVEITEKPIQAVTDVSGNELGGYITFCLQDYQRAQEIAHAYKYYRAARVEISFIPYFNIAQTGGPGQQQLPQLYYGIDRVANVRITPTEAECLSRGMKPHLFTKKMRLAFTPNLLQGISLETYQSRAGGSPGALDGISNTGYQNSIPLFNKWLPTQQTFGYNEAAGSPPNQTGQQLTPLGVNPYALQYYGAIAVAAIEGLASNLLVNVGDLQIKVIWEFKSPRALLTRAPEAETNPYVATSSQTNSGVPLPNRQPTSYP